MESKPLKLQLKSAQEAHKFMKHKHKRDKGQLLFFHSKLFLMSTGIHLIASPHENIHSLGLWYSTNQGLILE